MVLTVLSAKLLYTTSPHRCTGTAGRTIGGFRPAGENANNMKS